MKYRALDEVNCNRTELVLFVVIHFWAISLFPESLHLFAKEKAESFCTIFPAKLGRHLRFD